MEEMNTDWVIDAIRELLILLGVKLWISRRMFYSLEIHAEALKQYVMMFAAEDFSKKLYIKHIKTKS